MARCALLARVDAHFERHLPADEIHALFEHLPDCPSCCDRYEKQLLIETLDPQAPGPKVRMRAGLAPVAPRRIGVVVAAGVFAVAASALFVVGRARPGESFSPRGHARNFDTSPRIEIYRVAPGTPARRIEDTIGKNDDLAFAYANPTGKLRLLVFAVDEHRHIYWYYPAWTDPKDAPQAVPIRQSKELVEMDEAVVQPIDASHVTLFAVFTDEPVDVHEVEARVASLRIVGQNLGLHDAFETSRTLEVR
jgi:hypothetical protein